MAWAGAEFAEKVLKALKGEKGIITPTFVHLSADKTGGETIKKEISKDLDYFSAPVELGVRYHLHDMTLTIGSYADYIRSRRVSRRFSRSAS